MYRFNCNFHINIIRILIELIEHVSKIVLISQHSQNFDFYVFDVSGFINFTVKILEILFILAFAIHVPDNVLDVLQDDVSSLGRAVTFTGAHNRQ